jgi:hypothetical protein
MKQAPLFLVLAAACGSAQTVPPRETPKPEIVRQTYGLDSGSCWQYKVGDVPRATVTIAGPDVNAVAGHTVYVEKYQPLAGGLPTEDYFDTEANGEIRLLRHIEGQADMRVSKRYDTDPMPPLFARFTLDAMKNAVLSKGDKFEVNTTPMGMAPEHHAWSVLATDDMVSTTEGMKPAYKLLYNRGNETANSWIVPGYGVAKFQDFTGAFHQVCAARVCDAQGTCSGADCASLACQ